MLESIINQSPNNQQQDTSQPLTSHFGQYPSIQLNDHLSVIDFDKELKLKTNQILTLQSQNQNFKHQIGILEQKNKYYDSEYLTKTNELSNQIKDFSKQHSTYQIELSQKTKTIANQSNTIAALDKENKYLKDQLSEMESNVIYLKQDVKKILTNKNNQSYQEREGKRQKLNQLHKKENELKKIINNYSTEISKLNQQLVSLQSNLEQSSSQNVKMKREIDERDNELSNYHTETLILKKKLHECEDYNSSLQRDKNDLEASLTNLSHMNTQNEKAIYSYDNSVKELSTFVNSEIKLLAQWVDTYMGMYYDRHFEVPSLQSNKSIDIIQFDILRDTLEASRDKLNHELANYEQSIIELKEEINKGDMKVIQLKKELNECKELISDHKEAQLRYIDEIDYYKKEIKDYQDKIGKFTHNEKIKDKESNEYIAKLLKIIKTEFDSIANDDKLASFKDIISFSNINTSKSDFGLKYQLEDILDKTLQILSELKFDYIKNKQQFIQSTSDSIQKRLNDTKESSVLQRKVSELDQEMSRQMELISKLKSENLLFMNQIDILENTIKTKENNESNIRTKHDQLKEEYKILNGKYTDLTSQYDVVIIEKKHIEDQLNQSRMMIEKGKQAEMKALQLEMELKRTSYDVNNTSSNHININQKEINITD